MRLTVNSSISHALAALALASLPLPAQSTVDAVLNRALKAHQAAATTKAQFRQTLTNPLTGTTATARGELLMERPKKISVRFTDPSGDRVVADGAFLWVYLPSQNPKQVIRLPQAGAGMGGIDVIGQFFDSPRTRYTITNAGAAKIGGRATSALRLVPKQMKNAAFVRATVWIDDRDGQMRQFEVTDANGLVRRVELTSVSVNAKMPKDAFRFIIPPGAKVVEQPLAG